MESVPQLRSQFAGKLAGYYQYARGEMLPFIPSEARVILEVGCSSGLFGSALKEQRRAEVWGVETVDHAATEAARRLDHVIRADIEREELKLPTNYFDCIVFNDVLEHLTYPWAVLKSLRDALRNSGCVVASIPNIRYYPVFKELVLRKQWAYTEDGVLDRTHFRFFTQKSIPDFFRDSGYQLVRMEGINPASFSWKLNLAFRLLGQVVEDMRYQQFACVAKKATT